MDLRVEDLVVEFVSGDYVVRPINGLSLSASSGQLVVLLGPSGSGKTTLLSCLAGILAPTSGAITVGDVEVTSLRGKQLAEYRRRTVGIAFQAFNLLPSLTALENVQAPLRLAGTPRRIARELARELLATVDLTDREDHRPAKLSGGQQQRVAIARALAHDPPVVLADEPTAHLDYVQAETVFTLIRRLARPGRLVVVSSHDDRMVPLADQVVELAPRFARDIADPERVQLEAGRYLFEEGDPPDLVYVVDRGAIEIVRRRPNGRQDVVAVIPPGDYFGELGPLFGFPRTAGARARGRTVVTGYSVRRFRERFAGDPRLAATLGAAGRRGEGRFAAGAAGNDHRPARRSLLDDLLDQAERGIVRLRRARSR